MDDHTPHILIIDDSPDTADSLATLVRLWGYDARAVYCGEDGLASALACPPRVVLLDIGMPRMDGFDFVARFRLLPGCASVVVVAITGYANAAFQARAMAAGIDHFFAKPADLGPLEELLARSRIVRPPDVHGRPAVQRHRLAGTIPTRGSRGWKKGRHRRKL